MRERHRDRKWERKMAEHMTEDWQKSHFRGKIAAGIAVLTFGVFILLERSGVKTPSWLVSSATILMAIGLVVLIKHKFKKFFGWVILGIGSILLLKKIDPMSVNTELILPGVLIILGVSIMVKAFSRQKKKNKHIFDAVIEKETSDDNYFESSAIFGGVDKIVMSKDFKGAKITSMFGGHEVNLMQADIKESANMDVTALFGGITIIVPSNWKVQSDLSSMFGGVEDKRSTYNEEWQNNQKTLYIKGSCAFGGIEIKSFA